MALKFRDSEALQVVVRSGLCPPEVLARGAKVSRDGAGAIVLAPDRALPASAMTQLAAAGVATNAPIAKDARAVRCWAEAIAPHRVPVGDLPSLLILTCESATAVVDLAAELVRLGCDRQELMVTGDSGIVRVVDAPTYTVVRALDREDGLRVYAPDPVGQDATWTELGWRHPLADSLRAERGTLLLVGADRWRVVPDSGWLGVDSALEIVVPGDKTKHQVAPLPPRRRVPLRLAGGRRDVPSLWVVRAGALAAIDKLLATVPEDVAARLTFAATGAADGEPTLVLRARTGRHAPPDLQLAGAEAYAPLHQMPDVYAPAGSIVEPPLRRERLRQVLGVQIAEVMWLASDGSATGFRVERIADSAFQPLSEWADYVIHASVPALLPWLRATELDFAPFVSTGLEWGTASPDATPDANDDRKKKRGRPVPVGPADAPAEPARPAKAPRAQPAAQATRAAESPAATRATIDAELAALEAAFVALDAPADAPERLVLFERLGAGYARVRRRRESALCFARAVWEVRGDAEHAKLDAWLASDLHGVAPATALASALGQAEPQLDDVRLVAVLAARGAPAVAADPHRVTRWLDDHDGDLDARSLWLARAGLAALAGGDQLALAHARDRILARLAGGLPVERELPAFLRLAGRSGALGNASGEQLGNALEDLVQRVARTKRKRTPVEAPVAYTNAYAGFQIAHGFARIGQHQRARQLVDESTRGLAPVHTDPVHAYLIAAFATRVDQAIAGLPPETSLGDVLEARLAAFDRVMRYKIDRLREASWILSPTERPEAIAAYASNLTDSRGAEFDALRAIHELAARAQAIGALVDKARTADAAEQGRLVDGILDVLPELPETNAVPLLQRTVPMIANVVAAQRARLYAEALVAAGHFGRAELVRDLLEQLSLALRDVPPQDLHRVLTPSLRALRRIGLRAETAELLARAEAGMPPARGDTLRGRLAIASGLAFLGDARALPMLEQARRALDTPLIPVERLELIRSLALAYAQAPLHTALAGISDLAGQLKDITDHFGTNTHFCLSVLHVVESLVLGLASDDLALGESGRRFVEDDEHLIRRRLHRDLGGRS
jgi:hypothetical protein|nr:hypothetical protein [Kofleriaceae bacterium]